MDEQEIQEGALRQGRTFIWHELYVPDAEAGVKFYEEALGFGKASMPVEGHGSYTMLTKGGKPVCGVMSTNNPQMEGVPPHWATYLSVEDLDASMAAVEANGGKIVVPTIEIPTVGKFALIADPQGAHIWIMTPQPG